MNAAAVWSAVVADLATLAGALESADAEVAAAFDGTDKERQRAALVRWFDLYREARDVLSALVRRPRLVDASIVVTYDNAIATIRRIAHGVEGCRAAALAHRLVYPCPHCGGDTSPALLHRATAEANA